MHPTESPICETELGQSVVLKGNKDVFERAPKTHTSITLHHQALPWATLRGVKGLILFAVSPWSSRCERDHMRARLRDPNPNIILRGGCLGVPCRVLLVQVTLSEQSTEVEDKHISQYVPGQPVSEGMTCLTANISNHDVTPSDIRP
jgi:hypothetical protein